MNSELQTKKLTIPHPGFPSWAMNHNPTVDG